MRDLWVASHLGGDDRVCILELPSSQIPAVLQTDPHRPTSHPAFIWPWDCPPAAPPPPYKGHFFCDFKILGSCSFGISFVRLPPLNVYSFTLQWDSEILSPPQKSSFSSSSSALFKPSKDWRLLWAPMPASPCLSGYAYTKISSLYLIWLLGAPWGYPEGHYLFFQ